MAASRKRQHVDDDQDAMQTTYLRVTCSFLFDSDCMAYLNVAWVPNSLATRIAMARLHKDQDATNAHLDVNEQDCTQIGFNPIPFTMDQIVSHRRVVAQDNVRVEVTEEFLETADAFLKLAKTYFEEAKEGSAYDVMFNDVHRKLKCIPGLD